MNYKIRYLQMAYNDIGDLSAYLSQFYPSTLKRILNEIALKVDKLASNPKICQVYDDDPFYRRLVVLDYLVFYHVDDKNGTVDIHRVLRAAWDLSKYL